jgi:hypothetical protein
MLPRNDLIIPNILNGLLTLIKIKTLKLKLTLPSNTLLVATNANKGTKITLWVDERSYNIRYLAVMREKKDKILIILLS